MPEQCRPRPSAINAKISHPGGFKETMEASTKDVAWSAAAVGNLDFA